jgi:hypothetical protein
MNAVFTSPSENLVAQDIERRSFAMVNGHDHFLGQARRFRFDYGDDVLTVQGHVPSPYLRQVLERVLSEVDGVHLIDNQVTVSSIEKDDMVLF